VLLNQVSNAVEFDVDDVMELCEVDEYHISLTPTKTDERSLPVSDYIKLDFLVAK
jgi:hypothetical protein